MRFGLVPVQSLPRFDAKVRQGLLTEVLGLDMLLVQEHHSADAM